MSTTTESRPLAFRMQLKPGVAAAAAVVTAPHVTADDTGAGLALEAVEAAALVKCDVMVTVGSQITWQPLRQKLEAAGYIRKRVALLDRKKIGLNTQVFAQIKLNAHGRKNLTDFAEAMHQFPEVLECHVLMGAVDFMLRIVTRDIESYERFFFEKLSAVPGIQEVNSIVALSEIKSTTTLPLLAP